MKQENTKHFLAHKEDNAVLLTVGINQEGFSHRLVYDYLKIPKLDNHFLIFKNGYLDWFCNRKLWDKILKIVMNRIKNDRTFGKRIWDITLELSRNLDKECYKALKNIKRKIIIFEDWQKIISLFHQLYSIGMVPPISDIQHFSFTRLMEGIIAKKIEQLKLSKPIGDYFSVLTMPTQESYFQKSERELLKIAIEIKDKKISQEQIDCRIKDYLEKYTWIEYAHLGPALTTGAVKKKLGKCLKENPKKKLKEIIYQKNTLPRKQKKLEAELKLSQKEKQLFKTARYFGQHKARRLATAYLANYTINQALKLLAKKYGYSYKELRNLTRDEFFAMMKSGKKVPKKTLKQRQKFCVNYVISYGNVKVYTGKMARNFIKKYVPREKIDILQQILKGSIACAGKAVGRVKIINNSADMAKMNKGDILVAVQTMPQLLPAMKKAAAIITDIGGLTCHAAIVARELNIPCIIGTWNATKILKDNNLIEVNADEGVVKILNK